MEILKSEHQVGILLNHCIIYCNISNRGMMNPSSAWFTGSYVGQVLDNFLCVFRFTRTRFSST